MHKHFCAYAYTAWLFIRNDIKTMIGPSTVFAFCAARAERLLSTEAFIQRLPVILCWTVVNLFAFTVNNQRFPASIVEDAANKPWRPIPSGRITASDAEKLGWFAYSFAIATSLTLGCGSVPSITLAFLGWLYNHRAGGEHWIPRNILNALGFASFAAGALSAALGQNSTPVRAVPWLGTIVAVVCSTVHTQDMYDQEGDAAAGRKTIPLVFGDVPARWSIAAGVMVWSISTPLLWHGRGYNRTLVWGLGLCIALRTLLLRSVKRDKTTFRIYNMWLVALYCLPLSRCTYSLN